MDTIARLQGTLALAVRGLRVFTPKHALVAVIATVLVALLIGTVTVLIPNSVFGRDIPPVAWNYPVWILTSMLSGLLIATSVRTSGSGDAADGDDAPADRSSTMGMIGTVLAWFAVGYPVCNKIALLAFGHSGAITWFAPMQPVLAVLAIVLTAVALVWRLKGMVACEVPAR